MQTDKKRQSEKRLTSLRMILQFLEGAKAYFMFGALFVIAATVFDMVRPKIIQYTVDSVLAEQETELPAFLQKLLDSWGGAAWLKAHLWVPALLVVLFSLCAVLFRYWYQMNTAKGGELFVKTMRDRLFHHIEHLSSEWHGKHQTGDIIQRCTSDVEMVKGFVSDHLVNLVNMVLVIVLTLIFMAKIDPLLTLIGVAGIPVLSVFAFWFWTKIGENFRVCDENEGVLSTIAQENLTGVRVVRAFGREKSEQVKFAEENEVVTDAWVVLGKYMSLYFGCADFLSGALSIALLSLGTVRCITADMTVGELLAMMSYMAMLIHPVRGLGRTLSEMSKAGVSISRIKDIMSAPVEEDLPGADCPPMDRDITFEHVSFGFPGQPELLHDISFTIPAGTTLGIMGGTGSGKSTLINLLTRLYPLEENGGRICVGGQDIRTIQAAHLRGNIGYVLQEPYLFSRSIAENIALTKETVEMEEVRSSSRAACLEDVVDTFAKGFDTFVGERGVTLSGGQKQRVAIARTLMQQTPILVFDDSLSAVDAETDAIIRENLKKYMGQATVILISHRITTLMAADQILVMEDGAIIDRGTHRELSERPGLYQTICQIQEGKEVIAHA